MERERAEDLAQEALPGLVHKPGQCEGWLFIVRQTWRGTMRAGARERGISHCSRRAAGVARSATDEALEVESDRARVQARSTTLAALTGGTAVMGFGTIVRGDCHADGTGARAIGTTLSRAAAGGFVQAYEAGRQVEHVARG